ncbi:MAG TPA: carboxypeptidase regulatory-like domain-containing protein [Bryobacteraceae bacterium]|nr:carboxypeptidase regulatory-like domain-containing protein [Bryobacteraceae bacterium]
MRFCYLLLAVAALLSAQEYRGTFSGTVTDPTGAAIAKATVTATETRTGAKSTAVTGDSGAYTIPFLAPGIYEITAEAPGFKKYVHAGVTLSSGESPVVDIRLAIGALTDAVTVTGEAPLLEASSPTVGQVLSTKEVDALPVNGRTPMMYDQLAFGVVSTYEPGPVRPFDNGAPNEISIGGAPSNRNEVLLNGAPNAGQTNQMAYSPIHDAVTEVRVNTFDMDAAYGHTMGGTINVITKGGTNGLHGASWIYNQTSVVDANSFFNNAKNQPRPPYHQNQYGAMANGPIYLPKLFNGRNKVFWLFAYEGMRDSDPANSPLETGNPENFATVPTDAERGGDFSALLKAGGQYTIYDPATGVLSGAAVSRTPFPNNVIPASRINPIAQALLKYYPEPNWPGLANGSQNFIINAVDSDGYDNEMGRLDINLSDRNKLAFDVHHNYRAQNKNNFFNNPATGNYLYRINQGAMADDVYSISPTLFADVRGSWTRFIENHSSPADGIDPASLGFPPNIDANSKFRMLPYITFASAGTGSTVTNSVSGGARSTFEPLGYNGDSTNYSDIFQIFGDVVKIHGNHTWKAGADLREYRWSGYTFGNPSGSYGFNSNWTNNPALSNTGSPVGQEFAAFLLGLPTTGSIDLNTQDTVQAKYAGFFFNDDWKVKPNLTLSLGVRWEHDFPEYERWNRSLNGFDPTAANSISAAASAAYAANPNALLPASQFHAVGGPTFAASSAPAIYHTESKIFSPRAGFAWTPAALGGKTVIRGGAGVLVDPIQLPVSGSVPAVGGSNNPFATLNQPGFSQTTNMTVTNNNYLTPAATISNPFPNGILQPAGAAGGYSTNLGSSIVFVNPHLRNPYVVRWELSVQRALPKQFVLEVAYIGNRANHLPIATQLDYIPRKYLSTSLVRDSAAVSLLSTNPVPNPFKGLLPNSSALNGSTVALGQLLIPFPQYAVPAVPTPGTPANGVIMEENPAGSSYYESANIRLQKRYSNSLTLLNNFTWNRLTDRTAYLNDSDPAPEKRISSDSRPLRDVMAATYALPVGRGRALDLHSRLLDGIAGGWGLSGVLTLQSGPPLGWGNYIYLGGPLSYNAHQPNGNAFDIAQFVIASSAQLAYNIRTLDNQFNNLRRDSTRQLDLSMTKDFRFHERAYLQVRLEAFNASNRVTFGAPTTTVTSSSFGEIGTQANTPRRLESAVKLVW